MTASVSLLPSQSGWVVPPPDIPDLSDYEQSLVAGLSTKLMVQAPVIQQRWSYYDGVQRLQNLGISIPPQLSGVRTVVDWPRIACDVLAERVEFAGFRLPGATDVDSEFAEHLRANDFWSEFPMAVLDSLVGGRGYLIVGSPDVPGDSPLVTVESPLNMTCTWDPRTKQVTSAYQAYEVEGIYRAVLYLPDETVFMSRTQSTPWTVDDRDQHLFGEVPVVRLPNRARTSDREGRSQITEAIMNATDSTCRSLLGMEIAREVYSIPRMWIIGAAEDAFVGSDGTQKTALDVAMTKVLGLERDEEGEAPTVGQFQAFDPAVFTKMIDSQARIVAAECGFPPAYFGVQQTANPSSADAIRVAENRIDRATAALESHASGPLRKFAQLLWRFANDGNDIPDALRNVAVDWVDPSTPTPAATTDAVTKQIASGMVSPRSLVALAKVGYNDVERTQIAQEWDEDPGAQILAELSDNVAAKDVVAALRLLKQTGQPVPPQATLTAPPPDASIVDAPQATPTP